MGNKVIMEDRLFYVTDEHGNADQQQEAGHGLYMKDTRFLSHYQLRINDEQPELLGSGTSSSYMLTTLLKHEVKDVGAVEVKRSTLLWNGKLHEQLQLTNYFLSEQNVKLSLQFDADFQDMFIVRRYRTGEVGERIESKVNDSSMQLSYRGKDELLRVTEIHWSGEPRLIKEEQMLEYTLQLAPGETVDIELVIQPIILSEAGALEKEAGQAMLTRTASTGAEQIKQGSAPLSTGREQAVHSSDPTVTSDPAVTEAVDLPTFIEAQQALQESYIHWAESNTRVTSSSTLFNTLYERSLQDLRMLKIDIGYGNTTVAGLPWFATVFGRDSLITSLFMLPLHPSHALGTLRTLAAYQGKATNPWRDEEFGKIMHEIRFGELVTTGQSPFSPYYGGVDSTSLFLVLLVEYVKWTGDLSIVNELDEVIKAALKWINHRCSNNDAGFLTYEQEAEQGFPNQGWKDSANSIIHQNGKLAPAPIALIEVQGYISYAKQGLADIWLKLGRQEQSQQLALEAKELAKNIVNYFWMEEEQFFSVALDGELKPVRSITSNPGHLLLSGLLPKDYVVKVGERLLADDLFSGYGIRTMSNTSTGYYPMSYHNGSVWPHDNGMILLGCIRSGLNWEARTILSGLLHTAAELTDQRFPELFCGYSREECDKLVPYPTTCSPQAWSGATTFVMLQAMLGLQVDLLQGKISLTPNLPSDIAELNVTGLSIGSGELDLYLYLDEQNDQTYATIMKNTTGLHVDVHPLSID